MVHLGLKCDCLKLALVPEAKLGLARKLKVDVQSDAVGVDILERLHVDLDATPDDGVRVRLCLDAVQTHLSYDRVRLGIEPNSLGVQVYEGVSVQLYEGLTVDLQ